MGGYGTGAGALPLTSLRSTGNGGVTFGSKVGDGGGQGKDEILVACGVITNLSGGDFSQKGEIIFGVNKIALVVEGIVSAQMFRQDQVPFITVSCQVNEERLIIHAGLCKCKCGTKVGSPAADIG